MRGHDDRLRLFVRDFIYAASFSLRQSYADLRTQSGLFP
jgi:hypothetical protein